MIEVGVFELVQAFRRIIAGLDRSEDLEIDTEKMSLTDRINEIMERLSEEKQLTFHRSARRENGPKADRLYFSGDPGTDETPDGPGLPVGALRSHPAVSGGGGMMEEKAAITRSAHLRLRSPP